MEHHFSWIGHLLHIDHGQAHIAALLLASVVLVTFSFFAYLSLKKAGEDVAPSSTLNAKGLSEVLVEAVAFEISDKVLGKDRRYLIPLFGSVFLTVLFNNLVGLIPGFSPATSDFNTTLALGIFSFVTYNYLGLRENGIGYLKHFLGPVVLLAPLMVVIEVISHLVRPLSLGVRLMSNMKADHTVMGLALEMAPFGVPILAYGLGIFVCLIQAFVFTILSMAYVSLATAHDH